MFHGKNLGLRDVSASDFTIPTNPLINRQHFPSQHPFFLVKVTRAIPGLPWAQAIPGEVRSLSVYLKTKAIESEACDRLGHRY